MAHLENSLKLKDLFYQRIKTEERSLPVLEKLKLAEECQRNVTSRDEYDHITKIVEELKKEYAAERKFGYTPTVIFSEEDKAQAAKVIKKDIKEMDGQVKNWLKNALSRNKGNFKPNDKYTFYYDDSNESEDQRVNEVLRYVENKIYRKWETSTKWGNLKSPIPGVDYSVKIEKRVDVIDAPQKSGSRQKTLKNPAIDVERKEVTDTLVTEG
ncbi:hypothetical protein PVE50_08350 [Bacillus toyonensis]|nr:hypothetical protein [Bacillus toyonensis]